MARATETTAEGPVSPDGDKLFDVTCVIGSVYANSDRYEQARTAHEAAMLLITRHDAEGHYTFPLPDGGTAHVTIEFDHPTRDEAPAPMEY